MDTDWFSMMADEWPERRAAIIDWLDNNNFDEEGNAKHSLQRTIRR